VRSHTRVAQPLSAVLGGRAALQRREKDDREPTSFASQSSGAPTRLARWDGGPVRSHTRVAQSRPRLCLVEERRFSAAKKMIENPLPCAASPRAV
jgi:hypothetical protein